ncbi:putative oxidoreductase YmfI [Porphyridium purpureum]|uniref:Putative oxidoreductase YmfI n=1 Tax=Porphyridium purpureum TaxID=35688 RepID=A0A5J4YI52_PORPP|nr:putative oxidoreductase YmfI [Porphyridium purpureum]|eukprot:POR2547..scf289_17
MANRKTILVTGAGYGIGKAAVSILLDLGHRVLLHDQRANLGVLERMVAVYGDLAEAYVADLSRLPEVEKLADAVRKKHTSLDVLINHDSRFLKNSSDNHTRGRKSHDERLMANTIAPYVLTKRMLPLLKSVKDSRVVNVSSWMAAPVSLRAMSGKGILGARQAYSQSKLALNMWTQHMAKKEKGVMIMAIRPSSLSDVELSKLRDGTLVSSKLLDEDVRKGADALVRASFSGKFSLHLLASGRFFDNQTQRFHRTHATQTPERCEKVVQAIEKYLASHRMRMASLRQAQAAKQQESP